MNSKTSKASGTPLIDRSEIIEFLDATLNTKSIKDISCNGLQVQGTNKIRKIGLAVDACMETYKLAVDQNCQMLIAHHGIIWNGIRSITDTTYEHVRFLLKTGLNLYASHLPLDLHPIVGNNIQLANLIGLGNIKPFGLYNGTEIGFEGTLNNPTDRNEIVKILCNSLNTECSVLPFGKELIQSIAIVSGGAAKELSEAITKKVDCYITGEPIYENYHAAREAGINVIYAGHYHSEKMGVQALGMLLHEHFGVETAFLDINHIVEHHGRED